MDLEAMPTPSKLQLEANTILKSGWWNTSQSNAHNICGMVYLAMMLEA